MIHSFEPIIDKNSKILILGTMPGVKSLQKSEYYGHAQNAFWKIIYSLFNEELTDNYLHKKEFLLKHGIALWDVLQSCDREGSSDSNIRNTVPNDFISLFNTYPNIKAVCFNGQPAEKIFKTLVLKKLGDTDMSFSILPSTSPANTMKFDIKFEQWKGIFNEYTDFRHKRL